MTGKNVLTEEYNLAYYVVILPYLIPVKNLPKTVHSFSSSTNAGPLNSTSSVRTVKAVGVPVDTETHGALDSLPSLN